MDMPTELLSHLTRWLNANTLLQIAVLAVATLAAWTANRAAAHWLPPATESGTRRSVLREAALLSVPYVAALLVLLAGRGLFGFTSVDTRLLDESLTLFGSLMAIRGVTFLVRVSLGPRSRLKAWELRVTLLVWFFVAMQVLGLLGSVTAFLDSIALTPAVKGSASLTMWSLIR